MRNTNRPSPSYRSRFGVRWSSGWWQVVWCPVSGCPVSGGPVAGGLVSSVRWASVRWAGGRWSGVQCPVGQCPVGQCPGVRWADGWTSHQSTAKKNLNFFIFQFDFFHIWIILIVQRGGHIPPAIIKTRI